MSLKQQQIHATLVALGESGALLLGPSGSGKSDLALRFIMSPPLPQFKNHEPIFIADDRVILSLKNGRVFGAAPQALQGKLEVRHLGIKDMPFKDQAEIKLVIELLPDKSIERLPPEDQFFRLLEQSIPLIQLDPFEASAVNKMILALNFL